MNDSSLRAGFLRSAAAAPDAVALTLRGRDFSYGYLERTARDWAAQLIQASGGCPRRVGVFGSRSEVSYAGVLAALFSGAAFVPLNPKFPVGRTRDMIRLADLDVILVDANARKQLDSIREGLERVPPIVAPDDDGSSRPLEDLPAVTAADPAYLLFTSGSTGTPKGVPVSNGNAGHFLEAVARRYEFSSDDRFSQTFDQTFDLSVFDLFAAWQAGARVCVPEPIDLVAPTAFIRRHQLTVWFSVPSIVALMRRKSLLQRGSLPTLRWSLFCGEALPRQSAEAWQEAASHSTVENLYGPTELTIACLVHRWNPQTSPALCVNDVVPIGGPLEGLDAVVVNEGLEPVTRGVSGELCVAGPQTVAGYWRDPVRTEERFVPICGADLVDARYYRTGDRVVQQLDGEFIYLGRTDDQIKIRGYRVELGEIEAALRADGHVVNAAAIGWPIDQGSALGVVAFVAGRHVDPVLLARSLEQRLPDYMVPGEIVLVEDFPLNANGKVDRAALRERLESRRPVAS